MTDITDLIKSLRKAMGNATPGPWAVVNQDCRWNIDDLSGNGVAITQQRVSIRKDPKQVERTANAEFIALANPENVGKLCDSIEHRWVKCSDRMPEDGATVLVCQQDGIIFCAEMDGGELYPDEFPNVPRDGQEITHWMPMPCAPME
ncbi:DUF551 domain-containing protein [Leminorella grimontii]|uniref:DUF551 domain-containing protein n=1 Tax=Leminorella grimontii TaxID=82981 RepID=UPI00208BAC6D|nr:DUF551 domain-containing protein [Leminorella grimontii]GKX60179.1 hypothetical protein SOASR031_24940 [Leminorella grimontii]